MSSLPEAMPSKSPKTILPPIDGDVVQDEICCYFFEICRVPCYFSPNFVRAKYLRVGSREEWLPRRPPRCLTMLYSLDEQHRKLKLQMERIKTREKRYRQERKERSRSVREPPERHAPEPPERMYRSATHREVCGGTQQHLGQCRFGTCQEFDKQVEAQADAMRKAYEGIIRPAEVLSIALDGTSISK